MLSKTGIQETVIFYFKNDEKIVAVYLYGSLIKGHFNKESDVDIALLFEPSTRPSSLDLLRMSGDLETLIGQKIDLNIIRTDNVVFAKEVIEHGECIENKDRMGKEIFEMTILSMYANLQFERKEVLDAYTIG